MTGAVERALKVQLVNLPADQISQQLQQAAAIESYLSDLRELAFNMLENGQPVPGYKLVPKQARRQWVKEEAIEAWVDAKGIEDAYETKIKSPAQLEKVLKKAKLDFPADLVVAVSSGSTLAPESDPRPAVLQIGRQLTAALNKLS